MFGQFLLSPANNYFKARVLGVRELRNSFNHTSRPSLFHVGFLLTELYVPSRISVPPSGLNANIRSPFRNTGIPSIISTPRAGIPFKGTQP